MTCTGFRSGLFGLAFLLVCTSSIGAQPIASSLAELKRVASPNAKATVTDTNGHEFRGAIAAASDAGLSLRIGKATRRFDAAEVDSVRVRKEDSLANGALIGAAVGGGLTSLLFLDNECRDDPVCYRAVAVYAGIGATAGLTVDALIHRNVVVYTARTQGPRHRVTVKPIVAPGRKEVRLMVAF